MQNKENVHVWFLPLVMMLFLFLPLPSLPNWFLGWFRRRIGGSLSVFILLPTGREGRTDKFQNIHFLMIRNVKESCKVSENPLINLKLTNRDVAYIVELVVDVSLRWLQTLKRWHLSFFLLSL